MRRGSHMKEKDLMDLQKEFEASEFFNVIGMKITSVEVGRATIELASRKELGNVRKTIHGGVYMTLLDTTMGLACRSIGYDDAMTMQMNTHFLKPAIDGTMIAKAAIISRTTSTMLVEGKIYDELENLLGFSTATFRVTNE